MNPAATPPGAPDAPPAAVAEARAFLDALDTAALPASVELSPGATVREPARYVAALRDALAACSGRALATTAEAALRLLELLQADHEDA